MDVSTSTWIISSVVLVAVLALDVFVIGRNVHEPSMKEAGTFVGIFVALAIVFGLGVWATAGSAYAGEFYAGWLTEYSLSIDNLFIFLIIMSKLAVPRHLQQYALTIGIILALIFRAVFIAVGAAAISKFSWVFFIFGAFLIYTAFNLVKEYRKHDEDEEEVDNALMRLVKRRLPSVDEFHGRSLSVMQGGRRLITPMFFVIVALGSTDLLFALDSIPAIYGLTEEPYLVFTANVFALMGLRQLYFLLGGLLQKLIYLSLGLSFILAFIGVKLVLHAMHKYHWADWAPFDGEIPIWLSLTVIIGTLAITTVTSLVVSSRRPDPEQDAVAAADRRAV
ncbi:TerC family protein [Kineosporia sp. J2-2]|uniref:TerC family protein n=1 Tax=Kineosporia corallincola TaxID=2835133 RepID=A0ABS5TNA3_9ACTN|nr:TerC family protein [Kineosporia corallincola]MBT0772579.1 TerC family protein [Kineosporia corallincola]